MDHHGEDSIAIGSTGTLLSLIGKEMEVLQARRSCSVSYNMSKRSSSAKWDAYDGSPPTPTTRFIRSLWNDLKGLLRSPSSTHMNDRSILHTNAVFCSEEDAHVPAHQAACYAGSMASPSNQSPYSNPCQGRDTKQRLSTSDMHVGVCSTKKSPTKQRPLTSDMHIGVYSTRSPKQDSVRARCCPVDSATAHGRAVYSNDMQAGYPLQNTSSTTYICYSNQRYHTSRSAETEMAVYPNKKYPVRPNYPNGRERAAREEIPLSGLAASYSNDGKLGKTTGRSSSVGHDSKQKLSEGELSARKGKGKGRIRVYGDAQIGDQKVNREEDVDDEALCRILLRYGECKEEEECTLVRRPPPPTPPSGSPLISAFKRRAAQRSLAPPPQVGVVDLQCCYTTPNRLSFTKLSTF